MISRPRTFPESGERVVPTAEDMRAFGEEFGAALVAGDLVILDGPLGAGKTTLTQGIAVGMNVRGRVTSPTFTIARHHRGPGGGPDLVHVDAYRLFGEEGPSEGASEAVGERSSADALGSRDALDAHDALNALGSRDALNALGFRDAFDALDAHDAPNELNPHHRFDALDALDSLDLDTDLEACVVVAEWGAGLVEQLSDSHLLVSIDRSAADDARRVIWRRVS